MKCNHLPAKVMWANKLYKIMWLTKRISWTQTLLKISTIPYSIRLPSIKATVCKKVAYIIILMPTECIKYQLCKINKLQAYFKVDKFLFKLWKQNFYRKTIAMLFLLIGFPYCLLIKAKSCQENLDFRLIFLTKLTWKVVYAQ